MKKKLCIGLLLLGSCVFLLSRIPFTDEQRYLSKMRKSMKSLDTKIRFYGKVVDQFDKPIKGAVVQVQVKRYDRTGPYLTDIKEIEEKTDKDGLFEVKARGQSISFKNIRLDGYEYSWRLNPVRSFQYSVLGSAQAPFIPDSKKPIVFVIRERNMPTYLTKLSDRIICRLGQVVDREISLIGNYFPIKAMNRDEVTRPDIKVSISNSEDEKSYAVIFLSLDNDGGMILSDDLLYEAPEEGYETDVQMTFNMPEDKGKIEKYIYVKARTGAMYSRLEVVFDLTNTDSLRINITGFTNPDSSRNLEYDEKYQFKEMQWRREASSRLYKEKLKAKRERRKFDEDAFIEKMYKEKAELYKKEKKEDPKWWHKLEDKAKGKD